MKRIGLMGCGMVADYGHIPAIQATSNLALHALFDPNPSALKRMQQKFGVPKAFTDTALFFASGIEAVSIASPVVSHKENVLAAAAHGLPVLCEKPLAPSRTEAEEMIMAMKRAGASFYAGFCYRFSPCALKIRELIKNKAIGEPRSLRLIYNWDMHGKYELDEQGKPVIQKRRHDRMMEGGPLVDCGTHQIDLAEFWLASPVVSFTGHGAWVDDYEAPDHVWLHMDHANGAETTVEVSYSYLHTVKRTRLEFVYELIGTGGVIRYDREAKYFGMENREGTHVFAFAPEKNFEGMYAEWARALESGQSELLTSPEAGMRVVEIAHQATEEAIRNRRGLKF